MAQFSLYKNTDQDTNEVYPYFVDVQNGLLDSLNSRVVIPLTPVRKSAEKYPQHLCPILMIKDNEYSLLTHQLTSVPVNLLKKQNGSLASNRDSIVAAIDFLVTGI